MFINKLETKGYSLSNIRASQFEGREVRGEELTPIEEGKPIMKFSRNWSIQIYKDIDSAIAKCSDGRIKWHEGIMDK